MNRSTIFIAVGLAVSIAVGARAQDAPVPPFKDVPTDHWAYQAVESLRQRGIIRGYPGTDYRGKRTITRYEAVQALSRILMHVPALRVPRETPDGPPGDRGPAGPEGEKGPKGETGPRGETPPEVAQFRAALEEMRKDLSSIRHHLDAADRKAGNLNSETRDLKKDAKPIRTGK